MAENVEDIEAKLAAYVDGELTPAERVEIETHLEANPSHRVLLKDLMQHRQLLRALPRENAPGDCTEGFQGQLERDILLGGDELTRSRSRFRIRYSPQLLSAAAILFLAIGLAVVVFKVLPPHHPKAPIAQLTQEPTKPNENPTDLLADTRSYSLDAPKMDAKKGESFFEESTLTLKDGGDRDAKSFGGAFKAKADAAPSPEMLVITVTADDLKGANEAVVRYLALNGINYSAPAMEAVWKDGVQLIEDHSINGLAQVAAQVNAPAPAQMPALATVDESEKREAESFDRNRRAARPAPISPSQPSATSQLQARSDTLEVAQKPAPESAPAQTDVSAESLVLSKATRTPTTQPATAGAAEYANRGSREISKSSYGIQPAGGAAGSLGAVSGSGGGGGQLAGAAELSDGSLRMKQVQRSLNDAEAGYSEITGARVILAHNMNGRQVQELATSLSQPERNQWAIVRANTGTQYGRLAVTTTTTTVEERQRQLTDNLMAYKTTAQQSETFNAEKFVTSIPTLTSTTRPAQHQQLKENIAPSTAGLSPTATDPQAQAATVNETKAPAQDFFQKLLVEESRVPSTQPFRGETFACYIVVQSPTTRGPAPTTQPLTAGRPTTAPAPAAQPSDTAR
jgi:hypothetical protein